MNALYKCKKCYGMTPRDSLYCVWLCGTRLPDKELRGKVKDNSPEEKDRMLPRSYRKWGESK